MLAFLLDEHIPAAVAQAASRQCHDMKIMALPHWRSGSFLGATDPEILVGAKQDGLTLVTYDQRTIRPLLKRWAEEGTDHSGLVFVDHLTIAPKEVGKLARALCDLWKSERRANWLNRVVFLARPPSAC